MARRLRAAEAEALAEEVVISGAWRTEFVLPALAVFTLVYTL